jgi:hypothetical protein
MKTNVCLMARKLASILGLTSACALAAPPADRNAWRFDEWSGVVAIPAGSYRGADKGVEIKQGSRMTVGPQVTLENLRMRGRAPQHTSWAIERSFLRDCAIGGDFGAHVNVKDSACQNSSFNRTGSWSIDFWSTGWRFENCVFAKLFMRDFGVGSSSVRADKCTFYDLTLPGIGYKEDPSRLAQSDRLRFEGCRFVRCTVPETFLASTVRCVFEDCTFPGPAGADWSKAKKAITVNAFIAGRGTPPVSYANTQLRVFFKTGSVPVAGATIAVAYERGQLVHSTIPAAKETLALGEIPLPVLAKAPPPGLATAPVAEGSKAPPPAALGNPALQAEITRIEACAPTLLRAAQLVRPTDAVALPAKTLGDEVFKLKAIRPQLLPAALPYADALVACAEMIRSWQAQPPNTAPVLRDLTVRLDAQLKRTREERVKLNR